MGKKKGKRKRAGCVATLFLPICQCASSPSVSLTLSQCLPISMCLTCWCCRGARRVKNMQAARDRHMAFSSTMVDSEAAAAAEDAGSPSRPAVRPTGSPYWFTLSLALLLTLLTVFSALLVRDSTSETHLTCFVYPAAAVDTSNLVCFGDAVVFYDFRNHGFITSEGCRHPISTYRERENRKQHSEAKEGEKGAKRVARDERVTDSRTSSSRDV